MKKSKSGFLSDTELTSESEGDIVTELRQRWIDNAIKAGMSVVEYMENSHLANNPNWTVPAWAIEYDASKALLTNPGATTAGIGNFFSGMGKYTPWIIGTLALGFALAIPKGSPLHQMFKR